MPATNGNSTSRSSVTTAMRAKSIAIQNTSGRLSVMKQTANGEWRMANAEWRIVSDQARERYLSISEWRMEAIGRRIYHSLLATRYSLLATHYSLLATRYSLLATRYSLLATRYSLLATRYSLLATRYSLLATRYSL